MFILNINAVTVAYKITTTIPINHTNSLTVSSLKIQPLYVFSAPFVIAKLFLQ